MSSNPPAADAGARAGTVPARHLTLHYRLSLSATGQDVINTFGGRPATLQTGIGQLAEPLERRLVAMSEGERQLFRLGPDEGFGGRNPDLVQRVPRSMLDGLFPDRTLVAGEQVELPAPDGSRFTGVLKSIDADHALIDFNHPLAGQTLEFEAHVLGVL